MSFIGRAEPEVKFILNRLLAPKIILEQVLLYYLIPKSEYEILDKEIKQHKFDLVVHKQDGKKIVVEVNYKHKEKAAKKWRIIFEPMLQKYGHETLTIKDYECESLFKPLDYSKHKLSWDDTIDVCNALKLSNISFPIPKLLEVQT